MYSTRPLGINTKENDRTVADEFLQESINMQWRDGALRLLPERIVSSIDVSQYHNIILHKVSDENTINVLGFKWFTPNYLAKNLAFSLGGDLDEVQYLHWFGTIVDGVYTEIAPVNLNVARTDGMSFTILNGIVYFMGNGSDATEEYYCQLQYDEIDGYRLKDMYAWKSLVPFYPYQSAIELTCPKGDYNVFSQCGVICIRIALELKSGEIVLHSPIYAFCLYGLNRSSESIPKGTPIENIHTFINMDFDFFDNNLFTQEVSAINIYATTPYYEYELTVGYTSTPTPDSPALLGSDTIIAEIQKQAEQPFYLIRTVEKPTSEKILLTVGQFDSDISYSETVSKLDISTIATGELMPVDNFTYHKIYGTITSFNGRLLVDSPVTILGDGHIRALATEPVYSNVGFKIDTEDGKVNGISYIIDKALGFPTDLIRPRGILSYPDRRATVVGGSEYLAGAINTSTINAAGAGYLINDVLTIAGGNENAKIKATAVVGEILSLEINNHGTGYSLYDVITVTGGGVNAHIIVQSIGGSGEVTGYTLSDAGTGYGVASNVATTSGVGIDFTINILSTKGGISAYSLEEAGDGYSVATGAITTVVPTGGTGFKLNITAVEESILRLVKIKKNVLHNMACSFDIAGAGFSNMGASIDGANIITDTSYNCYFNYANYDEVDSPGLVTAKYSSNNRLQFSAPGEFSVWPAINSYRIGEGKIMGVGSNVVNISSTDVIAPLIIGTTDGIYTINLDPSGQNFIANITKAISMPYLSRETLQIGDQLLFISDKGLYAFNNGDPINLTNPFFPEQGNGGYHPANSIFPNYNRLVERYFGFSGNPYLLDDIVSYLKGCILAYDERRNSVWCSNPSYNFSLVYDMANKIWSFSTLVFNEKIELFGIINTSGVDVYSRYLLRKKDQIQNNLLVLSGEDMDTEVEFHILTRPIKTQYPDSYKKIERMFARVELIRSSLDGYFTFGIWGKQDLNKNKTGIPIKAIIGSIENAFPNDVRQDIPVGMHRGKYKSITVLLGGKALPESSIDRFDIEAYLVNENKLR